MAEASGWIVAALVAVLAVVWRMFERARSAAVRASLRAETDLIVKAQRASAIEATRANVEEIAELVGGDDPEGKIADRSDEERAAR